MGFLDKAKDLAKTQTDKVAGLVDKAGDVIDEKTGGKFTSKIEQAEEKVTEIVEEKLEEGLEAGEEAAAEETTED